MSGTHQVVYVAARPEQAHLLREALRQQGIYAYVTNEALQIAGGDLPVGLPTAARVVVHEDDAAEARQIALDFDAAMQEDTFADEDEEELDRQEASRWPACPGCGRPRHTSCPVCETAGTSFPRAYLPPDEITTDHAEGDGSQKLVVVCPTCDEPFTPEFLARCEWCGYRFRDGRELPAADSLNTGLEINGRALIVLAGLLVVVAGVLGLFVYVARH